MDTKSRARERAGAHHFRLGGPMAFPDFEPTAGVFIRTLVERYGENTLVVLDDRRLRYDEAEKRSARLARGLLSLGVGKSSRVGILLPNGPDWIVSWLAVTRIGAIAVPINTFFQSRELGWMLRHADVQCLLTLPRFLGHDYLERLETAAPGLAEAPGPDLRIPSLPYLRAILTFGDSDRAWTRDADSLIDTAGDDPAIDEAFLRAVESNVTPADSMMLLYSSGSTADPKGAVHTHGSVIRHSHNLLATRDLDDTDRIWTPMPFFWVGGFVFSLLGSMHRGACILCEESFNPEKTLLLLEQERATMALGWPHFGQTLANHPSIHDRDLSSLRAGNIPDLLPESVVPSDPELRPNALGMTETCGPHTAVHDGPMPETLRGSHGVAVEGVEHKIVDPQTSDVLPRGEFGEICVRGYSLMQALHKTEREATFDRDGYYHTGDAGYFDPDGVLYFKGRLGDMIKTAGANVTPSEVEQVLASFPEIQSAYVVGVPDEERGQLVVASVILEPGSTTTASELRTQMKTELSAYKVPRHLFIDRAVDLPFTESGKIDKRKLTSLLTARISGAA